MLTLRPADLNQVVDQRLEEALKEALKCCLWIDTDCKDKLIDVLPLMCTTIDGWKWLKLQQRITSAYAAALDSRLDVRRALKSEVAAGCILFLFLEVPLLLKEHAALVLNYISFGTCDAPNVSSKEEVEAFVLDVLSPRVAREEVQRQVCLSIYILANVSSSVLKLVFSRHFQVGLLLRIRNSSKPTPKVISSLMDAIASIACVSHHMRTSILDTLLTENWLGKLMREEDGSSFLEPACVAVAYIVPCRRSKGEADNKCLWDHFISELVPVIVEKCCLTGCYSLTIAAASALVRITKFAAASTEWIDVLVKGGCLRALFGMNHYMECEDVLSYSLKAIIIILGVGDDVGDGMGRKGPKHNEYAKLVDTFEWGWDILHPENTEDMYPCSFDLKARANEVLEFYRPEIYQADDVHYISSSDDSSDGDSDENEYQKKKMMMMMNDEMEISEEEDDDDDDEET